MRTTYTPAREPRRWVLGTAVIVAVTAASATAFVLGRATAGSDADADAAATPTTRNAIPVPDRRTQAGAATAAITYQIAGFRVSTGTLDAAAAADVLLAPQASDSAHAVLAPVPAAVPGRTTYAPLSAGVREYTPDSAEVELWGVVASSSLTGAQPQGTENWGRIVVTLAWDGAQWRVSDHVYSSGPWPVPADARQSESDGDFSFRAKELTQGWAYVPEE